VLDGQTFVLELLEAISRQAAVIENLRGVIASQQLVPEAQNVRRHQLE